MIATSYKKKQKIIEEWLKTKNTMALHREAKTETQKAI